MIINKKLLKVINITKYNFKLYKNKNKFYE